MKRSIVVLSCLIALLFSLSNGCRALVPKKSSALVPKENIIWPEPKTDELTLTDGEYLVLGVALARRFHTPSPGQLIKGAFFFSPEVVDKNLPVIISICRPNEKGRLGNIAKSKSYSTRVVVSPSESKTTGQKVRRLSFSIRCKLEGNRDYWLVIEPGWESERKEIHRKGMNFITQPLRPAREEGSLFFFNSKTVPVKDSILRAVLPDPMTRATGDIQINSRYGFAGELRIYNYVRRQKNK